jgi:hypothetical protein
MQALLTLLLLQPSMEHGMALSFAWATTALDTTVTAVPCKWLDSSHSCSSQCHRRR